LWRVSFFNFRWVLVSLKLSGDRTFRCRGPRQVRHSEYRIDDVEHPRNNLGDIAKSSKDSDDGAVLLVNAAASLPRLPAAGNYRSSSRFFPELVRSRSKRLSAFLYPTGLRQCLKSPICLVRRISAAHARSDSILTPNLDPTQLALGDGVTDILRGQLQSFSLERVRPLIPNSVNCYYKTRPRPEIVSRLNGAGRHWAGPGSISGLRMGDWT
jgi:hypothetical protein